MPPYNVILRKTKRIKNEDRITNRNSESLTIDSFLNSRVPFCLLVGCLSASLIFGSISSRENLDMVWHGMIILKFTRKQNPLLQILPFFTRLITNSSQITDPDFTMFAQEIDSRNKL